MKSYYRIILGKKNCYAKECLEGSFIGADFDIKEDLSQKLADELREFNKEFIPVLLENDPNRSKISAGLACGSLHTISKCIKKGDIVLCPDGSGIYHVGEITSDYQYAAGRILPHRRGVKWFQSINRDNMSDALKNSTGSIGTVSNITKYTNELENLIAGKAPIITDNINSEDTEDPITFALEKHLEDFLIRNWPQTDLGKDYDIFMEDDDIVGQQYQTDTGTIDILAIRKDKKEILVVELKRGRASDVVIGQTLRYMGYVAQELAEENQLVTGVIIAMEKDQRLDRALSVVPNISFYKYQVDFKLSKET